MRTQSKVQITDPFGGEEGDTFFEMLLTKTGDNASLGIVMKTETSIGLGYAEAREMRDLLDAYLASQK